MAVAATMGSADAASFIRLYMVPGMQHCGGGSGATVFGQQAPGAAGDPEHNVSAALERWVEQGIAPGPIVASKIVGENHAHLLLRLQRYR